MLLPPLLAGTAIVCLLLAVAVSFGQKGKDNNPLAAEQPAHDEIVEQLSVDLEGTPTPADIRRAQKPLSERRRLLHAHPYFSLYKIAKHRFDVSWYLVAAVHYQETGFGEAPMTLAGHEHWRRHRNATANIIRPTAYPHKTKRHPSVKDDFDVVMAIAANLKAEGARNLGEDAKNALATRYGSGPQARLTTAMIIERARAWRLLGTLPLPGSGELATPVRGVVGGCGYFGCPRPGHLHNGVDFLAPTGTPIHAADGGVVASIESPGQSGGYGNLVCVQHRPNLSTCYAHMSAFAAQIRPGARVRRGQVIGLVGSTGSSTAPHLHFEVRRGPAACSNCAVDPLPMLSGDVPNTALPKMVGSVPLAPRAASSSAPLPIVPAPVTAPVTEQERGETKPADEATAPAKGRNRPRDEDPHQTGGAVPNGTTPPATPAPSATPAPAPTAPAAPAPATPTAPAANEPAAPTSEPGTGGVAPQVAPPPPPAPPTAASTTPPG
ncbi:MAG TPA: M23 family metallopeptidase [Solirubrobacteraceae bacterium]|nr:M23 family metallopeptidase [Solirubrobacteraceae bacterium]